VTAETGYDIGKQIWREPLFTTLEAEKRAFCYANASGNEVYGVGVGASAAGGVVAGGVDGVVASAGAAAAAPSRTSHSVGVSSDVLFMNAQLANAM